MPQKIHDVPTVRPAPAIRSELVQQRRFRLQQLEELKMDAAEAQATPDEPRLQITHVLTVAAELALSEIDAPPCSGSRRARTGRASDAGSQSHGSDWRCCR